MHYGTIKKTDIANGIGVRVSLFVSGCPHHCKECFNPETWDFAYGDIFNEQVEDEVIKALAPSFIEGLTLLGGEPMHPDNQRGLLHLLRKVKEHYPDKTIWCYTGYVLENDFLSERGRARCEVTDEILSYIDVLVDGPFVLKKKDIRLKFRGSSNQRLIDMKKTLATGEVVIAEVS